MNIKPTGGKKLKKNNMNMNITKSKSINKSKHRKTHMKSHLNQTIQRIETQQGTQIIDSQTKP